MRKKCTGGEKGTVDSVGEALLMERERHILGPGADYKPVRVEKIVVLHYCSYPKESET